MNKIIWRKWKDPLYPLVENWEPEIEDEESSKDGKVALYYPQKNGVWNGPVIVGPQGSIPLTESNLPGVLFNFWCGDSNFTITKPIRDAIARVDGVETLDVMTRYRFRLGIGRAFDEKKVKRSIDLLFEPKELVQKVRKLNNDSLSVMTRMLAKKHIAWAIVVMRDGKVHYCTGQEQQEVEKQLKAYEGKSDRFVLSWEQ
jgi:hypothetical protein